MTGGFGSRPLAVLENKAVFEAKLFDRRNRLLKFLLGFTAETDNKVARDCGPWNRLTNPLHHLTILFNGVTAFHPFEYRIGTTL